MRITGPRQVRGLARGGVISGRGWPHNKAGWAGHSGPRARSRVLTLGTQPRGPARSPGLRGQASDPPSA